MIAENVLEQIELQEKLNKQLDKSLAKETKESWDEFLDKCESEDLEKASIEQAQSFGYMSEDYEFKENVESFKEGAKWQRERTIRKACEWLYLNAHTYIRVSHVGRYENVSMGIDFIDDFRKAMID